MTLLPDINGREVWVAFDEWGILLGVFAFEEDAKRAATGMQHGNWWSTFIK